MTNAETTENLNSEAEAFDGHADDQAPAEVEQADEADAEDAGEDNSAGNVE